MLTNTYECLAIILRSLRLVANCIRKPIRLIFATFWRICREYMFLHSQGYSPQCEPSIRPAAGIFVSYANNCLLHTISFGISLTKSTNSRSQQTSLCAMTTSLHLQLHLYCLRPDRNNLIHSTHRRTGRVRGGGATANSGSLSTLIRAESRDYSGKTQYMFD